MTLEQILDQTATQGETPAVDVALVRDALALAPVRLARTGLFWPPDGDAETEPASVYTLARRHTQVSEHEKALEALGDDELEGWALANDYAQAAYALGIAMGYRFALGAVGAA